MLTIKSDDVYGRSKAYESIIKKTAIVGPKVPESFNVLVKELQGLGLKVDLVQTNTVVDAEEVLSGNIRDEAAHVAEIEVPQNEISEIDVTEDSDFSIVTSDADMDEVSVAADTSTDDTITDTEEGEEA
jgi:DNA-directed RNA polymerase subunit beta